MNLVQPPRWAERLLAAVGADAEFRDEILGDLAEEFTLRVRWDGLRDARRWYVREAARTLPYLVRDGAWRASGSDLKRLANVVGLSHLIGGLVAGTAALLLSNTLGALGLDFGHGLFPVGNVLARLGIAGLLADVALAGLIGGHVAARLGRRAPLVGSIAFGAWLFVLAVLGCVWSRFFPHHPPLAWIIGQPIVGLLAPLVGGAATVMLRGSSGDDDAVISGG